MRLAISSINHSIFYDTPQIKYLISLIYNRISVIFIPNIKPESSKFSVVIDGHWLIGNEASKLLFYNRVGSLYILFTHHIKHKDTFNAECNFMCTLSNILLPLSNDRKVMFSQAFVCSQGGGSSPCDHYLWCIGPHCTYPSPTTDIWQSSVETCSNLFTWGPTPPHSPTSTYT